MKRNSQSNWPIPQTVSVPFGERCLSPDRKDDLYSVSLEQKEMLRYTCLLALESFRQSVRHFNDLLTGEMERKQTC